MVRTFEQYRKKTSWLKHKYTTFTFTFIFSHHHASGRKGVTLPSAEAAWNPRRPAQVLHNEQVDSRDCNVWQLWWADGHHLSIEQPKCKVPILPLPMLTWEQDPHKQGHLLVQCSYQSSPIHHPVVRLLLQVQVRRYQKRSRYRGWCLKGRRRLPRAQVEQQDNCTLVRDLPTLCWARDGQSWQRQEDWRSRLWGGDRRVAFWNSEIWTRKSVSASAMLGPWREVSSDWRCFPGDLWKWTPEWRHPQRNHPQTSGERHHYLHRSVERVISIIINMIIIIPIYIKDQQNNLSSGTMGSTALDSTGIENRRP